MRLSTTFRCSDATFIAALIVVDRLLEYDGGRLPLTPRNVHRIFFASLVVAVKYHEDLVYSNSHYAKAGGVHLREVNRLERVLLMALDFDLRIAPEQYHTYEAALLSLSNCSQQKGSVHTEEGYTVNMPSTITMAPATPSSAPPTVVEAPLPAGPPQPPLATAAVLCRQAVLAAPSVRIGGVTGSTALLPSLEVEPCAPWVVPADRSRSILNLELGMLAVPASR